MDFVNDEVLCPVMGTSTLGECVSACVMCLQYTIIIFHPAS